MMANSDRSVILYDSLILSYGEIEVETSDDMISYRRIKQTRLSWISP